MYTKYPLSHHPRARESIAYAGMSTTRESRGIHYRLAKQKMVLGGLFEMPESISPLRARILAWLEGRGQFLLLNS